jgi:hypothetical protein
MITLSDGVTEVELHKDLQWADEYNWLPVEQVASRSVTGAHIVQAALRIGGRPITLQPEDDRSAWMPRATVDALREWAATPALEMTLTINGTAFEVVFRHQEGSALQATPVMHYDVMVDEDHYLVTLRFMEI